MVCATGKTTGVDLSSPTLASQVAKSPSAALEEASLGRAGLSVSNPLSLYCGVSSLPGALYKAWKS